MRCVYCGREAGAHDEHDECVELALESAMTALRCGSCGRQVGVRTPGPEPDPEVVVVRCYECKEREEAGGATVIPFPRRP